MTSKRFLAVCFASLASIAAIVIPLNVCADLYGLFRPARGRALAVYGEERTAKYLYSLRYIPENFDGVLLGSSVSGNLDPHDFPNYRIYNASIDGGNVADLKPMVDNIFSKGDLKLTIISIHRYLTNSHALKTDLMTPKQYWGALASPQLLSAYVSRIAIRHGIVPERYDDECGTLHYEPNVNVNSVRKDIDKAVAEIQRGTAQVGNYYIDPAALIVLRDIITVARRHSHQLVIFYPPTPEPVLAVRSAEFTHYRDTINALLDPRDIVVDFNSPRYESLRANLQNYIDAVHLSKTGARAVMFELSKVVEIPDVEKSASLR